MFNRWILTTTTAAVLALSPLLAHAETPAQGGESEVAFEPARPLRHHKAMSARRRERVN